MKIFIMFSTLLTLSVKLEAANLCETSFEKDYVKIEKALKEKTEKKRWSDFQSFMKKYDKCLDASYAESMQSLAENALVNDWKGFTEFVSKTKTDNVFRKNIESGFSLEMSEKESLKLIQTNAKINCPRGVQDFCTKILKAKF